MVHEFLEPIFLKHNIEKLGFNLNYTQNCKSLGIYLSNAIIAYKQVNVFIERHYKNNYCRFIYIRTIVCPKLLLISPFDVLFNTYLWKKYYWNRKKENIQNILGQVKTGYFSYLWMNIVWTHKYIWLLQ